MPEETRGAGEALFGSRTRALLLGYLAQASRPATGYAMAKALALGVSKVYPELRRLAASGLVELRFDVRGGKTYFLADEDLRRFLARKVPVMTSDEWFSASQMAARREGLERARRMEVRVAPERRKRGPGPMEAELRRPRSKDRAVARLKRLSRVDP